MTTDFYLPVIETLFRSGTIAYTYERIRCDENDALLDTVLSWALPTTTPTFTQVSGIPGAGKSTFCKRKYPNALLVQFDALMTLMPAYQRDCERLGLVQAFSKWEMPARVMGYELIRRLIAQKISFVLEHSGMNAAHLKLVEVLKSRGFHTELQFLGCSLEEACRRAAEREKKISRHTPRELIEQRANAVLEYLDKYKQVIDDTYIWDLTDVNNWILKEHLSCSAR